MSREIKIGIVAVAAILIVYFGIIFLKGIKLSSTENVYYITMSDVNGLSPQADVLANGMVVGQVKSLSFDAATQLVAIGVELNKGYSLPKGSTATLQKDMLGAPKVKVILGKDPTQMLVPGDTIQGMPMMDLMASAGDMMPAVEALMPKLDSILTALNALANNPAIPQTLANMEYVTGNLRSTTDQLNSILGRDVPQMMSHVNQVGANLESTTAKLNSIDYKGLADGAQQTLGNLNQFTAQLSNPNSTLGLLMNDASMYQRMDTTMRNASLLLQDLRDHPKRYVHFSLFGKKDK